MGWSGLCDLLRRHRLNVPILRAGAAGEIDRVRGTDFDGDLSVWFLKRSEKISGDRKLVIGLCFEAVGALVIAVSEGILPMSPEERLRGISAVSAWVMVFGMAVPAVIAAWMTGFGWSG